MTIETEIKGNELICLFLGFEKSRKDEYWIPNDWSGENTNRTTWKTEFMGFNSDWMWLMHIIEKIENLGFDFQIRHSTIFITRSLGNVGLRTKEIFPDIYKDFNSKWSIHTKPYANSKIEAAFLAVIDFIDWYNKNKI